LLVDVQGKSGKERIYECEDRGTRVTHPDRKCEDRGTRVTHPDRKAASAA
jgi:methyl coenzyme M reductase subunit D